MIRTAAVFLALTVTLGGCASGGAGAPRAPRRSPNTITQAELADASVTSQSAYDAIARLRPSWLRTRAVATANNSSTVPMVMINEIVSSMEQLRGLRSTEVTSMEYMSSADATTLYGTGYVNGLIKVRAGPR